jgi:hypothetical protein
VDADVWSDPDVELGGPAGVDVDVWSDPDVEVGGPAGVDVDVSSDPGVELGGPGGTEEGFPGSELGALPEFSEPVVPVFVDVPLPGVTPAQNAVTPSLPAAFWRFRKATLFVLGCPLLAINARHRPNLAAPVASGPTAFALFADFVPLSPVLLEAVRSVGTESPTCASAPWTADWAGAGRLPVAAAAPVAVRASAGMAMARALVPMRLDIMRVLSGVIEAAAGLARAAETTEMSTSRRTSSSAVAGAVAAWTSAATWAYPGGASSGATAPAKRRSAVSSSIGDLLISGYRSSGIMASLHLEGKIVSELGGQST